MISGYLACNKKFAEDVGVNDREINSINDYDFSWATLTDQYRKDEVKIMNAGNARFNFAEFRTTHDVKNDCNDISQP